MASLTPCALKLETAGANLDRIIEVSMFDSEDLKKWLQLNRDGLRRIELAINEVDAKLVVIDPVMSFLNPNCNSNNEQHVRAALTPLRALAERLNVAIILVRHLNKDEKKSSMYRGSGSIAFNALCRSVYIVEKADEPDCRIFRQLKANLAPPPPALKYKIEDGVVQWLGVTEELPSRHPEGTAATSARDDAKAFLLSALQDGPIESARLLAEAAAQGIREKTLRRAKEALGVVALQTKNGWFCSLPSQMGRRSDGQMATELAQAGFPYM